MNPLEAAGAALGLLNLWLTRQQNILCWPVGIACVLCYAFVFFEARLYSDTLLQLVYVAVQAYGWRLWARGSHHALISDSPITRLDRRAWFAWLATAALGALSLGGLMGATTDADRPFFDATATSLSMVAQYLQARKILDAWWLFIAGNALFIVLYVQKGLHLTVVLYGVSTVLAVMGWLAWRSSAAASAARM